MPVFPMLPKIDKNENKFLADRSGVWKKESGSDFLTSLVNSLASGGSLNDVGNIDSIPDVWAKPLLFKMALFDIGAAREFVAGLHDKVVGEWRALLAMFALKNLKQINLRAVAVNLNEYDSSQNEFARVFKDLVPIESFNGKEDAWLTDIYIIFYDGKPIAMTSPVTLVASAADYSSAFEGRLPIPWSSDGKTLTDPIKNLSHDELFALDAWLGNLYGELQRDSANVNFDAQIIAGNLLKCIQLYHEDVARALSGAAAPNLNIVASDLNLHIGTARLLNNTIEGREASIADSYVKLVTNPDRKNKKLILVSPTMVRDFARQENIDPARFVVWQGVNANDITEAALQGDRGKIGRISLGDTEYRRPEDFFYDQMAVLDETGDSFPGALKISGANIIANYNLDAILPIRRELLELFSPEEIVERLSFTAESDHNISLHFRFPLSSGGNGADFRFTKTYSGDDLIYIQQEIPVIEFWPNIQRRGWNKYYLYYENTQAQSKANADVLLDEMYYVEPWTFDKPLKDFPAQGLRNRITAQLDNFPEALIFNYKNLNSSTAAEIGLILLKKPMPVARQAGLEWKIGVDFGTSSTMLYFAEGKKAPKPLDFEPHLLQITKSGGARAQTSLNFIASVPKRRLDGSFLSMFHLLNVENLKQEIRPLLDGHILSDDIPQPIFESLGTRLDTNLKWQDDDFGRRKVAAYIRQICLQALVEAAAHGVESIRWNFSYPTAFSQIQMNSFSSTCRSGIVDACNDTDFASDNNVEILSESEAAAYYFNKLNGGKANFTQGAICIDIGAGTTDITIISGAPGRVVYHTSVQYAGRYIFKPIYDNFGLFADGDYSDERRQTLIDIDMRNNSDKYLKDLVFKSGQAAIQDVLQGCQLAVGGLFYYLGKLVGVLHGAGVYTENKIPNVFVGGNGSRIFRWLTGGDNNLKNNPFLSVLEKMLRDASGLSGYKNFLLNQSGSPKVEVASGMIMEKPLNADEFFDARRINRELFGMDTIPYSAFLVGAEYSQEGKNFPAEDFISVKDISDGINVKTLNEFTKFVECFNAAENLWSGGIELDDESIEDIVRETNGFYVSLKGADPDKIFLEPIFIVELKNLMEMLNYA